MATSIVIEEERGTYVPTRQHPHNGYYAGDFSTRSARPDGFERAALAVQPGVSGR